MSTITPEIAAALIDDDPTAMEQVLCGFAIRLLRGLAADGFPVNAEVHLLSESGVATGYAGVSVIDHDRQVEYKAEIHADHLHVAASCLRHTGWCACLPLLIAKALCAYLNRWQAIDPASNPDRTPFEDAPNA